MAKTSASTPVAATEKKPVRKKTEAAADLATPAKAVKAATPVKPAAKAVATDKAAQKEKVKKIKLVRDSFTMPEDEYAILGDVKKACLKAGIEVKKSELLRVGVALIRQLQIEKLREVLTGLPALKAGRPKKSK